MALDTLSSDVPNAACYGRWAVRVQPLCLTWWQDQVGIWWAWPDDFDWCAQQAWYCCWQIPALGPWPWSVIEGIPNSFCCAQVWHSWVAHWVLLPRPTPRACQGHLPPAVISCMPCSRADCIVDSCSTYKACTLCVHWGWIRSQEYIPISAAGFACSSCNRTWTWSSHAALLLDIRTQILQSTICQIWNWGCKTVLLPGLLLLTTWKSTSRPAMAWMRYASSNSLSRQPC